MLDKGYLKGCLLLAAMLLITDVMTLASPSAHSLDSLLEQARSEVYAVPERPYIVQAEEGFRHWLFMDDRREAAQSMEIPGVEPVALSQPDIVVLIEKQDDRLGRGLYAARVQGSTPLLIQAPHQYYDLHTGTLASQLFLESDAMASAWNTMHRYHGDDSDLVHISDSYLHALSRAFADVYPGGRILQLHGFSSAKRKSRAGREAEAILSDGSRKPLESLSQLTRCLSQRLGIRAMLFPRDVRELGATTNTVGSNLRARGFDGFVHLELESELRKRLISDADARNSLIQCVTETSP
ncbi:MAG: hypothetical protein IBX53_14055 [Halomonas sp.]|uniref:hypothetical protein n=1 Tax=Halomonas sp. TaxID=1486246 RepID=UPI0019E102C4|nr:hypothetical protein [Halomonas sp.]MBE0490193.1 hypothetical protein [Halomonas sp.]